MNLTRRSAHASVKMNRADVALSLLAAMTFACGELLPVPSVDSMTDADANISGVLLPPSEDAPSTVVRFISGDAADGGLDGSDVAAARARALRAWDVYYRAADAMTFSEWDDPPPCGPGTMLGADGPRTNVVVWDYAGPASGHLVRTTFVDGGGALACPTSGDPAW